MQKNAIKIILILLFAMALSLCACTSTLPNENGSTSSKKLNVQKASLTLDGILQKLDDASIDTSVSADEKLDVIIETSGECLSDAFLNSTAASLSDYMLSDEGQQLLSTLTEKQESVKAELVKSGLATSFKHSYTTLLNGFSTVIRYGDIAAVEAISGVKRVIVSELYSAPDTVDTKTLDEYWNGGTGILVNDFGYNGEGMTVAVIDTGLDFEHPVFATAPENPVITYEDIEALYEYVYGYGRVSFTASDLYRSAKVPFTFDYANMDADPRPTKTSTLYFGGDHGTHVAGIIAGDNDVITGSACKAQLIGMKVFKDSSSTASTSDIVAALSDAAIIGVDAINMSLGSPCGFTYLHSSSMNYVNEMYDKLRTLGIGVCASAGNSYNASYVNQSGYQSVNNPEYSVLGAPGSYDASFSVASCEAFSSPFFTVNGVTFSYGCSVNSSTGKVSMFSKQLLGDRKECSYEIVPLSAKGYEADYTGFDVKGKIVLVQRGGNNFSQKARIAEAHGAVGVIIYSTSVNDFNPGIDSDVTIPVAGITSTQGENIINIAKVETPVLTVSESDFEYPISAYSSWGPVSDLTLKPDITAPGGNIFSSIPSNSGSLYSLMSGTSMASPNLTGAFLAVKQYIKETQPSLTTLEMRTLTYQLMMSTATQLYDSEGRLVSPRHQGSGLVNIDEAVSTKAYLSVTGSDRTKLSLGDDKERDGVYTLSFNLVNFGTEALSYEISVAVLADQIRDDLKTILNATHTLDGNYTVSVKNALLDGNTVTVQAGETAAVKIVITLNESDIAYLEQFPNGTYVEGYCVFKSLNDDGIDLSIPYLAFYGDFTQASAFDKTIYETSTDYYVYPMSVFGSVPDTTSAVVLGAYALYAVPDGYSAPVPAEERISISGASDAIHSIYSIYSTLLRDVEYLEYKVVDAITGEVYYLGVGYDIGKSYLNGSSVVIAAYELNIDFTEIPVSNNQQLQIITSATLDYDGCNKVQQVVWPLYIDMEAPSLANAEVRYEEDHTYLELEVFDNHYLQCFGFGTINSNGDAIQAYEYYIPANDWKVGQKNKITFDMTDYIKYLNDGELIIEFVDYALNKQSYYLGSILPENNEDSDVNATETDFALGEIRYDYSVSTADFKNASSDASLDNTTSYTSINANGDEEYFFVDDNGMLTGYVGPGGDVVIPDDIGVKSISGSRGAFSVNKSITSIVIPEGVTRIEDLAFYYCTKLKKMTLPTTLEYIGANAINVCLELESINLQDTSCTYFGRYAFGSNVKLKELIFPAVEGQVIELGYNAVGLMIALEKLEFLGDVDELYRTAASVPNLETVIFHGNVGSIYGNAFMGCTKLSTVEFKGNVGFIGDPEDAWDTPFAMLSIKTIDFMGDVDALYSNAFNNCKNVERVTFHGNVGYISGSTFVNSKLLTEFTVAEGNDNLWIDPETRIMYNKERNVMMKPSNWDYDGVLTVPETVTELTSGQFGSGYIYVSNYILNYSFGEDFGVASEYADTFLGTDYKYKLKGVILHEGITNLPTACFNGCLNIEEIDMSFIETDYLSDAAFANCASLKTLLLPEEICEFGEYCFYGCGIKEFTVPDDITWLPYYTFMYAENLEVVDFNNVEEIDDYAFFGCSSLKSVYAPYVCYVGEYAFTDCTALETVEFSEDWDAVYTSVFMNCTSLTSINLTDCIERIDDYAFANTTSLSELYWSENLSTLGSSVFVNSGLKTVTVNSNVYFDISEVFYGLNNLESFEFAINSSYYSVKDGIVYNKSGDTLVLFPTCLNVPELALESYVTSIGDNAFLNAKYLVSIDLNNVVEIGVSAFRNTHITSADLSKVEYIDNHAFRNTDISEVTISSVNEIIGYWAFADNTLDRVTIKADAYEFNYTFAFKDSIIGELIIEDGCSSIKTLNESFLVSADGTALIKYVGKEANVIVPEGIVTINADAFKDNKNIETVVLPSTLKAIGDKAFYGCTSLKTVEFKSKKAPSLYGLHSDDYRLCYANFINYVEALDTELTAIVPDIEAYDGYIWHGIFASIRVAE